MRRTAPGALDGSTPCLPILSRLWMGWRSTPPVSASFTLPRGSRSICRLHCPTGLVDSCLIYRSSILNMPFGMLTVGDKVASNRPSRSDLGVPAGWHGSCYLSEAHESAHRGHPGCRRIQAHALEPSEGASPAGRAAN